MTRLLALPEVIVEADRAGLPTDVMERLGRVSVAMRLSSPTAAELTFQSPPGPPLELGMLSLGSALRLSIATDRVALFDGEVTAIEHVHGPAGTHEARVRAYDALHRLRKTQALRALRDVTASDLAGELVADIGLSVEAATDGPSWPLLIQHRQSSFALLVDVCERSGLYLTADDGTLRLVTLEGDGDPVALVLGETLLEARAEVNAESACEEVVTSGWDVSRAEPVSGTSAEPMIGRDVTASVVPGRVGASGARHLVDEAVTDDARAEALSRSERDRRAAAEVTLWAVALGDARLRPGSRIEVKGISDALCGRYVITEAVHTIDENGYVTELTTAPPPRLPRPSAAASTLGVVSGIDDPEGIGRVRATLPTYGDVETDWMEIASPGAGTGKGLVWLPDVGDRVLVLLGHQDPARAIVLGGLHGTDGPPDAGIEDGVVARTTMRTVGGQTLRLDDSTGSFRIDNEAGSFLEALPDKVRLHAGADLEIDAPGHAIVIRALSVDFQHAPEPEEPEEPDVPEVPETPGGEP